MPWTKDEKYRRDVRRLSEFIVYDDIVRTRLNTLSESKEKKKGVYSYLITKEEAFNFYELLEKMGTDDFLNLIKKTPHGEDALDKFSYFGYRNLESDPNASEDRLKLFVDEYRDKVTGLIMDLEGDGVERAEDGYELDYKAKNSIYAFNKIIALKKLHVLLQEIEYAIDDSRNNYAAELMFYAGRLFEKANVIVYEKYSIRGIDDEKVRKYGWMKVTINQMIIWNNVYKLWDKLKRSKVEAKSAKLDIIEKYYTGKSSTYEDQIRWLNNVLKNRTKHESKLSEYKSEIEIRRKEILAARTGQMKKGKIGKD